jgi:hypothetical protein
MIDKPSVEMREHRGDEIHNLDCLAEFIKTASAIDFLLNNLQRMMTSI